LWWGHYKLDTGIPYVLSAETETLDFGHIFFLFLFSGRGFEEIGRERADFVHVTYDRVQWRVVIASDSIKAANLSRK
jgi:hypothetical protein